MKDNRKKFSRPVAKSKYFNQPRKSQPNDNHSDRPNDQIHSNTGKTQVFAVKVTPEAVTNAASARRFHECLKNSAENHNLSLDFSGHSIDLLASLEYDTELMIKSAALTEFMKQTQSRCEISSIQAAPKPRRYRTTTKRRGKFLNGNFCLTMGYDTTSCDDGLSLSLLEPVEHETIYRFALQYFRKPAFSALANAVNYVIIRGNYRKFAVIVNLNAANGTIIRKLKEFSVKLNAALPFVSSCYMYLDETGSDYYLEAQRPDANKVSFKKLFGPEVLDLTVNGIKLLYPMTAFSQVNEAMLGLFIDTAYKLLDPKKQSTLYDLYCGYGLFSLIGANKVGSVTGIDWEGPAIKSAKANAAHLYSAKNLNYIAGSITENFLAGRLPVTPAADELFLLDPPRNGTAPGVIEFIAERKPRKVLHIFCGTDEIPRELAAWQRAGYEPTVIIPFDMFAGTANLETMILLEPQNTKNR